MPVPWCGVHPEWRQVFAGMSCDCEMGPKEALCQNKHSPGPNGLCLLFVGDFQLRMGSGVQGLGYVMLRYFSLLCASPGSRWREQSPASVVGGSQRAGLDAPMPPVCGAGDWEDRVLLWLTKHMSDGFSVFLVESCWPAFHFSLLINKKCCCRAERGCLKDFYC